MDRVLRAYAQTAWTALDPLKGLDPEVRRAILLMPSTFRERVKVAPWTSRDQRRAAIANILAERRLMFELFNPSIEKPTLVSAPPNSPAILHREGEGASLYYQRRIAKMAEERRSEEASDLLNDPAARADADRRTEIRSRYQAIQIERARLDAEEAHLLTPDKSNRPKAGPDFRTKGEKSYGITRPEPSAEVRKPPYKPRGRDR